MKVAEKTNEQLQYEIVELRQQIFELQKANTNNELFNNLYHILAKVIENMPNGIIVEDLNHRIIYANSEFKKHTGYSDFELLGERTTLFNGAENPQEIMQDIRNSLYRSKNWCGEIPSKHKDGHNYLAEVEVFPVLKNGVPIAWATILQDITNRKQAENELEAEQNKLFSLLDGLPAFVCLYRPDHTILYANRYFRECFGDPEQRYCYDILHNSQEPCKQCPTFRVFATKKPEIWESTIGNGPTHQYYAYPFSDIDDSSLVLLFGINATEHKFAERKLQAAHQQLIDIIEFLPDATFVIDQDKKVIAWNRALEEMVGMPKEHIIGHGDYAYSIPFYGQRIPILVDLVLEDDGNITEHQYDSIERKGNKLYTETFVPSMFNGKGAHVCAVASPLLDSSGQMVGAIQTIRDITERKRTEASLRLSKERFSKVFNNSPLPMAICTIPDERFLYVNDNFENFTGYPRNECVGHTPQELNLWAKLEERDKISQLFMGQGFVRNQEFTNRMKSGELNIGLYSADTINFNDEKCMLCAITDITERKQFEKEIFRLDRLNLIGEMAAGIGHEVRNPMTTVRGFLQILRSKGENSKNKEYFDLMIEELDRANSIITGFPSLAKSKNVEYKTKNINTIVEALVPLIQADAMKDDKFLILELNETPDLSLNEEEMRQLILNLVRNGLEAMSPDGNLTIRTFADSEAIILSVQDQGNGIETDVLEKIGTPFFTTKESGTGLGLAVCYSIAARHNANINIKTDSGGTTFSVRFKV